MRLDLVMVRPADRCEVGQRERLAAVSYRAEMMYLQPPATSLVLELAAIPVACLHGLASPLPLRAREDPAVWLLPSSSLTRSLTVLGARMGRGAGAVTC
jgi:hypothetical protein